MKVIILVAGVILILLGVVSMVTPLPGSTLFIAAGSSLVICTSKRAERLIMRTRIRFPRFNSSLSWLENRMGERLSGPLHRTRPQENDVQS